MEIRKERREIYYLVVTIELAELNPRMIEAENIAVPVLNLIR